MTVSLHCDRDGCDSWAPTRSNAARDFLSVTATGGIVLAHACCWDCLTHIAAARSEPTEVIPL